MLSMSKKQCIGEHGENSLLEAHDDIHLLRDKLSINLIQSSVAMFRTTGSTLYRLRPGFIPKMLTGF